MTFQAALSRTGRSEPVQTVLADQVIRLALPADSPIILLVQDVFLSRRTCDGGRGVFNRPRWCSTLDHGSSRLFRPEAVLSRMDGSNPIFGERSRISGSLSCLGRRLRRDGRFSARELNAMVSRAPDVVFRLRSEKPSSSLGSAVVFPSGRLRRLPSPIQQRSSQHVWARQAPQLS